MNSKILLALSQKHFQWSIGCLLIILCANVLRRAGEPRPEFYFKLAEGFISAVILNGTLFYSFTEQSYKWRYWLLLPLALSALGTAFVMCAYHALMIPIVIVFYLWIGVDIFRRKKSNENALDP